MADNLAIWTFSPAASPFLGHVPHFDVDSADEATIRGFIEELSHRHQSLFLLANVVL